MSLDAVLADTTKACRDCQQIFTGFGGWCPACLAQHQAQEAEARRVQECRELRERLERIGIPRLYRARSLEELDPTPVVERMRQYRDTELSAGRFLALLGPTGVGKTAAAAALLVGNARAGTSRDRFYFGPTFARSATDFDTRDDLIDAALRTPLLVLDDLAVPTGPQREQITEAVCEVLCTREAERRATVVTSNFPPAELGRWLGDRLLDRFRGWGSIYVVAGESRRRPPGATT